MKWSKSFLEVTPSVPEARKFVSDSLAAVPRDVRSAAALLVSELATNAVVHATSRFDVTVECPTPSGRVRIEVTDSDENRPTPLQPPPSVPHGRGLLLVANLSDEWGVERTTGRPGKTVWFEISLPVSPARGNVEAVKQRRGRWIRRGMSLSSALPYLRPREFYG